MPNLENIQLTDTAKPMDYDAYWKRWLKVCIEGITPAMRCRSLQNIRGNNIKTLTVNK